MPVAPPHASGTSRAPSPAPRPEQPGEQRPAQRSAPKPDADADDAGWWRWPLLGIAAAWASGFVLPPAFRWFFAAIPHEMGHATIGCLLGRPSAPAISMAGHAWTGVAERSTFLVVAIALVFAGVAVATRRRPAIASVCGAAAVLLPVLACSGGADVAITSGGHLGELAFATYCFWLCGTGGRTGAAAERIAAAMGGSLLQFTDLRLAFGLMTSAAARDEYAANGSLGLKNDLLVLADDLIGCRLQSMGLLLLLLSLLPLPLGLLLARRRAA